MLPEAVSPLSSVGSMPRPTCFIGLDLHKHYLIATGVNAQLEVLFGPQRVQLTDLESWREQHLRGEEALVVEMTTNTWDVYDALVEHVHSVTVVHPPHVALITRAQVMTDKIAALTLARLHAVGLLPGIWIPQPEVRDLRALIAQRAKFVRLATQAKNRLHAVLHRHHLLPPEGGLFGPAQQAWWEALPLRAMELRRVQADWQTLQFAQQQSAQLEIALLEAAAPEARVPLLLQLPGVSLVTAMTILAAIGDIRRFPDAAHLVGYAGLGAAVHDSGLTHRTGRLTKAGRRDLRTVLVEAAQTAANTHPHWQQVLARLEPRLGRNKAVVAIARKLLVAVWYVLTDECADRFAVPERVARKLLDHAYRLGRERRGVGETAPAYVRTQLDRLQLGSDLQAIPHGERRITMPPSRWSGVAADPTALDAESGD